MVTIANIMTRNVRSMTGANLKYLEDITGMDPLSVSKAAFKKSLTACPAQPGESDALRVQLLGKSVQQLGKYHYEGLYDHVSFISDLINSLCIN